MYFTNFPNIFYNYSVNGENVLKIVKDVTQNVRLQKQILDLVTLYDEYDLQDGDTPDIVAAKYYGNAAYHWIIMMANDKYDYINDWPMTAAVLDEYIREKYNRFNVTTWSYTVGTNTTTITATCPNHGITAATVTTNMTNPVTLENVFVTTSSDETGDTYTTAAEGISYTGKITDVTESTITIQLTGELTATVPSTWPTTIDGNDIVYDWVSTGGFSFWATNRETRIKQWQSNGYVVDDNVVGAVPVTYYDYETKLNDSKRRIKLISPRFINDILNELQQLIG